MYFHPSSANTRSVRLQGSGQIISLSIGKVKIVKSKNENTHELKIHIKRVIRKLQGPQSGNRKITRYTVYKG